jgi:hypothetical protein
MNMIMKNKIQIWIKAAMILPFIVISGCFPDEFDDNGLVDTDLDASFVVVPDGSSPNYFTLKANANNYIMSKWELGDGAPAFVGDQEQLIFLPDAGTYDITHYAVGKGGYSESANTSLTVTLSDPNSGNIVVGGKFETADDISKWTVLNISASGTAWAFNSGKATVTGGGWNQQGFYQAINVIKDKTYKIDLVASSTTGVSNTWFEVFCSTTAPVQNNDYSAGGILRNINTWDGCGLSSFRGKISSVGCNADKNKGTFTAEATGTMYLVIKCGGENLNAGISVDNIEVRAQ